MYGWLDILCKNCPLYKMTYNVFLFWKLLFYYVQKRTVFTNIPSVHDEGKIRHTTDLSFVPALGHQRFGGQCTTYWNVSTISYNIWIITIGLLLKCRPGIALAFESQLDYTILNDMFVGPMLRKGNWTHIWKSLEQRGRVESAWWEKYK